MAKVLVVEEAKELFQKFLDKSGEVNDEDILAALTKVDELPMDFETLKETKIGLVYAKLSSQTRNATVASKATEILNKWKRDLRTTSSLASESSGNLNTPLRSSGSTSFIKLANPSTPKQESSPNLEVTLKRKPDAPIDPQNEANKARKIELGNSPMKQEVPSTAGAKSNLINSNDATAGDVVTEEAQVFTGTLSETPQRNTFQVRFWEALKQCKRGYVETVEMAIQIENELYLGYGKNAKEFPQKFRTLFSNLKDPLNSDLRDALFSGAIFPSELVNLTHEDLANPKLKKDREKIVDDATQAMQGVKPSVSKLFTCGRCKKNETSYYQMQTRSADEPMTTFISCIV